MNLTTRAVPGVYWDEHNRERRCLILQIKTGGVDGWRLLGAVDARTGNAIPDAPSAIREIEPTE